MSIRVVAYLICIGLAVVAGCATEVLPQNTTKTQPASQNESKTQKLAACSLEIDSDPQGATVIIDEVDVVGLTPLRGREIAPGPHLIQIKYDRYQTWSTSVNLVPGVTLRPPIVRLVGIPTVDVLHDRDYEWKRPAGPPRMNFEIELRERDRTKRGSGCIRSKPILPIDDTIHIDKRGFSVVESGRREERSGDYVKWSCGYDLDRDLLRPIAVSRFPRVFLRESKKPLLEKSGNRARHDVFVTVKAFGWERTVDAEWTTSKFMWRLPEKIRQTVRHAFLMDSEDSRANVTRMKYWITRCIRPYEGTARVEFNVSAETGRTYNVGMLQHFVRTQIEKCVIQTVKKTRFPMPAKPVCDVHYSLTVNRYND